MKEKLTRIGIVIVAIPFLCLGGLASFIAASLEGFGAFITASLVAGWDAVHDFIDEL